MLIHGIDLNEFYPYRQACKKLPGRVSGKPINERTIERWCQDGLKKGLIRVKLRVIRLGNDIFTCDSWLNEFLETLNAEQNVHAEDAETPRTRKQRESSSVDARNQFDAVWKQN